MEEFADRWLYFFCLVLDVLLFTILFFWSKHWKSLVSNAIIIGFLRFVLLYRIFAYGIVTNALRFITNGSVNNEKQYDVLASEILQIVVMEDVSNLIYYFFITFFLVSFKKRIKYKVEEKSINKISLFIVGMSIILLFLKNALMPFLWLIIPYIFRMSPALSVYLFHEGFKTKKLYKIIGGLGIVASIGFTLLSGHRGLIVANLILLLYFFWFHPVLPRKKVIAYGGILLIGFLSIQGPLKLVKSLTIGEKVLRREFTQNYSLIEKAQLFFEIKNRIKVKEKNILEKASTFLDEIQFRYGAATMFGTGFIRMRDKGEIAGIKPIQNSLYSFMPRQIFGDEKPFPSSIDGTEKGMGMYRVINTINPNYNFMTDFSVAGHYYWEFGWLGIIGFSLIPAFFIAIVIRIVENAGALGFGIFFACIKSFQLLPKMWISEIITIIPTILLPSLFFSALLIFFFKINYTQIFRLTK